MCSFDEVIKKIIDFRDERGWQKNDVPVNLAKSICIESSELLENFQWGDGLESDTENIKEELADVLMYALAMVHDLDLNVDEIITQSLIKKGLNKP